MTDDDDDQGADFDRRWDPKPGDYTAIRAHLLRQRGVPAGMVKLDNGQIVVAGADAEGEGDHE